MTCSWSPAHGLILDIGRTNREGGEEIRPATRLLGSDQWRSSQAPAGRDPPLLAPSRTARPPSLSAMTLDTPARVAHLKRKPPGHRGGAGTTRPRPEGVRPRGLEDEGRVREGPVVDGRHGAEALGVESLENYWLFSAMAPSRPWTSTKGAGLAWRRGAWLVGSAGSAGTKRLPPPPLQRRSPPRSRRPSSRRRVKSRATMKFRSSGNSTERRHCRPDFVVLTTYVRRGACMVPALVCRCCRPTRPRRPVRRRSASWLAWWPGLIQGEGAGRGASRSRDCLGGAPAPAVRPNSGGSPGLVGSPRPSRASAPAIQPLR